MEGFIAWVHEILGVDHAGSIIALSALIAWLFPKLLYFAVKLIFSTLLFLANVFGRDKVELWLKKKINSLLESFVEGAQVADIPRWLNKDQLALREVHWERAGVAIDVPAVIVTINLPTFGYKVFKLKLRYLFNKPRFLKELDKLLHSSVREIRVQEPAISYLHGHLHLLSKNSATSNTVKEEKGRSLLEILQEAVDYQLHFIIEHGSLQLKLNEELFVVQNINLDLYNRASNYDIDDNGYFFTAMLTGMYEGANISLANKPDSLTEYFLGINKLTVTPGIWKTIKERCGGLEQLDFTSDRNIGVLRDIRLALSLEAEPRILGLEGEYTIYKPRIKAWRDFESPASLVGSLGWDDKGLQLPDNFLVFQNGLRLRVPCVWQEGRLKMNFPTLEDLKQQYLGIVEQARASVKQYRDKLVDKIKKIL